MMIKRLLLTCVLVLALTGSAWAVLTESEATKLDGPVYTITGAERAGNKDGSIPAYTGGITKGENGWYYEGKLKVPFSKYDPKKSGLRPDPFADDKVLYTITAQNMTQYSDKLTPGLMAMMKKYPKDFYINVYPTRRSMAYAPEVIEGTKKSARTAHLMKNDRALVGAKCGFPFPFPKSGVEAVFNQLIHWSGTVENFRFKSHLVNAVGRAVMTTDGLGTMEYPYWDSKSNRTDMFYMVYENDVGPANRVGEGMVIYFPTDKSQGQPAWQYLPGQRRVKLAPEVSFDGPMVTVAASGTYDQACIYAGSPERYNWKIIGKKELIIPYNLYKAQYWTKSKDLLGPRFLRSEYLRHELHRVWVIEGTLKPTARHIYKKRILYIDEDSWVAVMADHYDMKDNLWRIGYLVWQLNYDYPAPWNVNDAAIDLVSGNYYMLSHTADFDGVKYGPAKDPKDWSPSILAGRGIR